MSNIAEDIAVLQVHRENLMAATTWENYRSAHVAFVEYLIEDLELRKASDDNKEQCIIKSSVIFRKADNE